MADLHAEIQIVSGANVFSSYAFNDADVKSKDVRLRIMGADSLKHKGTAYIVTVGINKYANSSYNLHYAVQDAQAFADELKRQQMQLGNFAQVVVVPLIDSAATKANLLRVLSMLAGSDKDGETERTAPVVAALVLPRLPTAEPEDAVFVYFAGHGTSAQEDFYLIPYDLEYRGERSQLDEKGFETIKAHSISDQELKRAFEGIDAGKLILIIDACNSGKALDDVEKRRGPMNSKGLAQLAYEKGMYILTASQGYQSANEVEQLGHGLLTYALLKRGSKAQSRDKYQAAESLIFASGWTTLPGVCQSFNWPLVYLDSAAPKPMEMNRLRCSSHACFIAAKRMISR